MSKKPVLIDEVHYLQNFKEGWRDGKWEHRVEVRDCNTRTGFHKVRADKGILFSLLINISVVVPDAAFCVVYMV